MYNSIRFKTIDFIDEITILKCRLNIFEYFEFLFRFLVVDETVHLYKLERKKKQRKS